MRHLAFCTILTALLAPAPAQAQSDDLLGKYASAKIYCIDDEKLVFEIVRGVINGPNFHCIIGNARPAGPASRTTIPSARWVTRCTSASSPSTSPTRPTMSG